MAGLVEEILGLSGLAGYVLVGLLAFGEAAAFVGLVLPGELAVLLGGVMAQQDRVSLPVMIVVTCVAAIAGDSVGYEIGHRYGERILAWPPFERRFADKVASAEAYLHRKGGRAVLLGRWTSMLRALIPGLAGMVRMPYRRFLLFNVLGGVAWATTFVLLGYAAGTSWRQVEKVAGQASLLLLALIVTGLAIRWATRRLLARSDDVRDAVARIARRPAVRRLTTRFRTPIGWVADRFTPGASLGLGWTMSVVAVGVGAWVAGFVVQDLLAGEELALLDQPVADWIAAHTTPTLSTTAEVVTDAFAPPVGIWSIGACTIAAGRLAGRAAAVRTVAAAVLAAGTALGLSMLLPVTAAGTTFPSVGLAWLTAALAAMVAAAAADPARAIRLGGWGLGLLILVGTADLVAADTALSGVVGGAGIGLMLAAGTELTDRTRSRSPARGDAPPPAAPAAT